MMFLLKGLRFRRLQKFFLAVFSVFLAFIIGVVVYNSYERKSLLEGSHSIENVEPVLEALRSPVKDSSEFQLREFHRVEIKNGKPVWEVKARDAKYYAEEDIAHVNDAEVVVHRSRNSQVSFKLKAGKLYLKKEALTKAEMEGDITVRIGEAMKVLTEIAEYDQSEGIISTTAAVTIVGDGYEVRGEGLELEVDNRVLKVMRNVQSRFQQGSKAPNRLRKYSG